MTQFLPPKLPPPTHVHPSTITFDNIKIEDLNGNDQWDRGIDRVTDPKGRLLKPKEEVKKMDSLLRELKVRTWNGIYLSKAANFLNNKKRARYFAAKGFVELVKESLKEMKKSTRGHLLNFPQGKANSLLQEALEKGIKDQLREAQVEAKEGKDIDAVYEALANVQKYSQTLGKRFGVKRKINTQKTDKILKTALRNGIPKLYQEAKTNAASGYISYTSELLDVLRAYISEANNRFSLKMKWDQVRVNRMMAKAYRQGISKEWAYAEKIAARGNTGQLKHSLDRIVTLILEANQYYGLRLSFDKKRAAELYAQVLKNN